MHDVLQNLYRSVSSYFFSFCLQWSSKRMKCHVFKPLRIPIVNLKLSPSILFRTFILIQWNTLICAVTFLVSCHKAAHWAHSWYSTTCHFPIFSPHPEHTVKACTSHQNVMMAHSVAQGHLRRQRFSMHKEDTLYNNAPLTLRGNMVLWKYWQQPPSRSKEISSLFIVI